MIFTNCPYCDEPQVFGWESGDSSGWFPSKCHNCENVMWVEATSIDGQTITTETFKSEIMKNGDEQEVNESIHKAENLSAVVYETN